MPIRIGSLPTLRFKEETDAMMDCAVRRLCQTGILENVKILPREHVRDDAGNSSSAITSRHMVFVLTERHKSAKRKRN